MGITHEHHSRYIIGIDLGTTTSSLSFVDTAKDRSVHQFMIPQLVGPGEISAEPMLPSACYVPAGHEFPEGALDLPWRASPACIVGRFARMHGAKVPGRLVTSAKSWLAHPGVDRTAGILPWGGELADKALSPVAVSRQYIEHLRDAWNERFGGMRDSDGAICSLEEQRVIVTVPASFDEAARELTVQAAREAGLRHLILLEEPLAVFYDWLRCHEETWQNVLREGHTVLVVDIGGGTTDFSLIRIEPGMTLRRTAAGEHLLLGGDNIDMALARQVEQAWQAQLDPRDWTQLVQQCREAKEALLSDPAKADHPVALSGRGSSVVAGARGHRIARGTLDTLLTDGFFPRIPATDHGPRRRAALREMGLPYAADAAVTRHLLSFLRAAAEPGTPAPGIARPDFILFNGGALIPSMLRARLCAVVGAWLGTGEPVPELESRNFSLAVSTGASYYGLVRRGEGVRVRGGMARAYYLEVARADGADLLCVMPRDTEEGVPVEITGHDLALAANTPVRFPLLCSATRLGDAPGDIVPDDESVTRMPSLTTIITFGKGGQKRDLSVRLGAMLNEVGTLDIWCATADGAHRFPLSFDLRATGSPIPNNAENIVDEDAMQTTLSALQAAFLSPKIAPTLARELERHLGLERKDWGALILRRLADSLLELAPRRTASAAHEERWLNLAGFALRPGCGAPGDEHRARECWKLWHEGARHAGHAPAAANWWIFWRRVSGGLKAGHQEQIGAVLQKQLFPKGSSALGPATRDEQVAAEMWRTFGSLELLPTTTKLQALSSLIKHESGRENWHCWVMARLGARELLAGPANAVIPPDAIAPLLETLVRQVDAAPTRPGLFALLSIARLTGIRGIDLPDAARAAARAVLARHSAPEEWVRQMDEVVEYSAEERSELSADSLPLGLMRHTPDAPAMP